MNDYFSKKKICAGENLGYGQIFFVVRIIMVLVGFIPTRKWAKFIGISSIYYGLKLAIALLSRYNSV
jgi:cadmium resistance protein CadD (predicted permease)